MPFNFIRSYLHYNSGNEVPTNFHLWTAVFILASAVHKRVYMDMGYFKIYPNLFLTLVAKQGMARKSTAKNIGADIFMSSLPTYPVGSAVQSREDIIRTMASSEKFKLKYLNEQGKETLVTPCVFFVNELKNFLSIDPQKMIEFLTDIYDRDHFDSSIIKRGLEVIQNPCINLLACEVPDWITDKLKTGIVSGGFARRMIYIYETERSARIAFPTKPPDHQQVFDQLTAHLRKVFSKPVGPFLWEPRAREWYVKWYASIQAPENETMAGYYESKHIQLFKLAMVLALAEEDMPQVLTYDRLMQALAMLDVIEVNMPKLALAAGRNVLALPTQKLLELIEKEGGLMPEKVFNRLAGHDLNPMEIASVKRHLQDTDQIVVRDHPVPIPGGHGIKRMIFLLATWQRMEQKMREIHNEKTNPTGNKP